MTTQNVFSVTVGNNFIKPIECKTIQVIRNYNKMYKYSWGIILMACTKCNLKIILCILYNTIKVVHFKGTYGQLRRKTHMTGNKIFCISIAIPTFRSDKLGYRLGRRRF